MPGRYDVQRIVLASRDAARHGGLPFWRQLLEMLVLKLCRDLGPNYYHAARFWRREVSFRDKWRHANEREYDELLFAINPVNYRKMSQHKVLEKATLTLFGIPTPRFIGFFHVRRGCDRAGGALINASDLARVLIPYAGHCVCFKPVEGFGGRGFAALEVMEDGAGLQHPVSGQRWTLAEWCEELQQAPAGWLLEECLPQHPELAAINASSVNTLRIWLIERDGVIVPTHALLRVGRAGSQVDNTTSGGLACTIDMATGRLQEGLDLRRPHQRILQHPDSGVMLSGRQVPFWPEALVLGVKALSVFPHMRFAGIDVAITPTGPAMIELNVMPDRISAVRWDLPHKDYFEPLAKACHES
ncbi:MAG: sugar-transfer associated ATP-grasp domain-containing protein [Permianibacter sp.]